jgi:hypothetical protein
VGAAEEHLISASDQAHTRGLDVGVRCLPPRALRPRSPPRGGGLQRKGERRHCGLRLTGADGAHGTDHHRVDGLPREHKCRVDGTADCFGLWNDPRDDLRAQFGEGSGLVRVVRRKVRGAFCQVTFPLVLRDRNRTVEEELHRLAEVRAMVRVPS